MTPGEPADRPRPRPRPRPAAADRGDEPGQEPAEPDPGAPEPAEPDPGAPEPAEPDPGAPEPADGRTPAAAASPASGRRSSPLARTLQLLSLLCVLAGIAVFVVARHDRQAPAGAPAADPGPIVDPRARLDHPAAAQAFLSAAVTEVVAVTESDYRRLDATLSAGLSVTTGSFRTQFRTALTGAGAAERKAHHRVTSIDVLAAGVGGMTGAGNRAKVLIFARLHQSGDDIAAGDRSVVITLCLTLVKHGDQYLIARMVADADAGLPPGTTGLRAAAEAARAEVVDYLSYRRSAFTADLARAKARATGALLRQLTTQAPKTLARMKAGKYDLRGSVVAIAARQVSDDSAVFLVAATGTRVADDGTSSRDTDGHYAVTVQRSGHSWQVSSITPVG